MSSTFTLEFGHEYEKERGRWLRRRFLWYSGATIGLNAIVVLVSAIALSVMLFSGGYGKTAPVQQDSPSTQAPGQTPDSVMPDTDTEAEPSVTDTAGNASIEPGQQESRRLSMSRRGLITQQVVNIPTILLGTGLYLAAFLRVRKHPMERDRLLSLVTRLIIYSGSIGIVAAIIAYEALRWTDPVIYEQLRERSFAVSVGFNSLLGIMMTHFLASLFLPWTPRESLRPILPLAALTLIVTGYYSLDRLWMVPVALAMSLVIALPGLLVCWLRNSRFRSRFHFKMVSRRYSEIKDELDAARQIHDAMFPAPISEGPVRMRYSYEPMRQIGGDYLFTHRVDTSDGEGRGLLVVLLDVTGHGITAALTVNRLQGEIERQVSMDRSVTPGTVLSGLNDYLHHTLARHSVYATALVIKVDPDAGTVVWASAGHPPGFLCTVDGTIHHLESTTIVLGATRGEHFQSVEEHIPFGRGDTILAYTDGV
ncbi:MAG: PP2C family protein-serine/threonine phosphatase, partial [Phycisphaerales bacterium JB050]